MFADLKSQFAISSLQRRNGGLSRFLIIDHAQGYHIEASIKDAGKKCFGINRIEDIGVVNDLIQRAEITSS